MYKIPLKGDESLHRLKTLLDLLDPSKKVQTGKNRPAFISLLLDVSRRHADYYHCAQPHTYRCSIYDIMPRFMHLLRECLLSHEWEKAARLMEVLCKDYRTSNTLVAKVGMASLMQLESGNLDVLQQYVRQASVLREIGVVEVFVEYLLHVLIYGDINRARHLDHELKKCVTYHVHLSDPRRRTAQLLFNSYQGLALYIQWKNNQMSMTDNNSTSSILDDDQQQAIETLVPLKDTPGVWDVFLSSAVEMLEDQGETDRAQNVLKDYTEKNPDNPNSHRYLAEFEQRHSEDTELQRKHLKELIRLDPCNPQCVNLYHLEKEHPSSVRLLFDYLDFHHCWADKTVLELLADRLDMIPYKSKLKKEVERCWETRKSWWLSTVLKGASKHSQGDGQDHSSVDQEVVHLRRKIYKHLKRLKH